MGFVLLADAERSQICEENKALLNFPGSAREISVYACDVDERGKEKKKKKKNRRLHTKVKAVIKDAQMERMALRGAQGGEEEGATLKGMRENRRR